MAELALQGLSKRYSDHVVAVKDLSLTIADHELIVLVGPSGCGKTTTLRLIAGLEDPSDGLIRFDGQTVNTVPSRQRNVAMVFQHGALYPHLTVFDNMAFGLRARHRASWIERSWRRIRDGKRSSAKTAPQAMSQQTIAEEVVRAARTLGIEHLLERWPRELSGGERQRVALGRAIVRRPAAFLLDEPLSSLDPQLRGEMRRELKRLQRRTGATMVYVTHDQAEAMALGDRVAILQQGRLQQVGTPDEVYDRPAHVSVARFIGEPPMNLLSGQLRSGPDGISFVVAGLAVPLPHETRQRWDLDRWWGGHLGCVTLGARPDAVAVVEDSSDSAADRWPTGRDSWPGRDRPWWKSGRGYVSARQRLGATIVLEVTLAPRTQQSKTEPKTAEPTTSLERTPWENTGSDNNTGSDEEWQTYSAVSESTDPTALTVVLPATQNVNVGARVEIHLDTSQLHLFDTRTGQNMLRVTDPPAGSSDPTGQNREP